MFIKLKVKKISQVYAAEQQLLAAITLYQKGNYIASLTLAGAAEEVLGKLVESDGEHSMYKLIKGIVNDVSVQLHKTEFGRKEFNEIANSTRNHLKHYNENGFIESDLKQECVNMLHRAIWNYHSKKETFMRTWKIGFVRLI